MKALDEGEYLLGVLLFKADAVVFENYFHIRYEWIEGGIFLSVRQLPLFDSCMTLLNLDASILTAVALTQ